MTYKNCYQAVTGGSSGLAAWPDFGGARAPQVVGSVVYQLRQMEAFSLDFGAVLVTAAPNLKAGAHAEFLAFSCHVACRLALPLPLPLPLPFAFALPCLPAACRLLGWGTILTVGSTPWFHWVHWGSGKSYKVSGQWVLGVALRGGGKIHSAHRCARRELLLGVQTNWR